MTKGKLLVVFVSLLSIFSFLSCKTQADEEEVKEHKLTFLNDKKEGNVIFEMMLKENTTNKLKCCL